ncbi:hypothetical protein FA13DRAFT_1727527 [Coprinellus micaceus]|uniref:Uncharacterized protein n=1 Tax=Coprinellus micaceus TaxID=71717 RepID=A0A4Y7TP88_COPMI|nr:hypothetical protein FA13DRAFT_1727527 [Coprinellus micaceus]
MAHSPLSQLPALDIDCYSDASSSCSSSPAPDMFLDHPIVVCHAPLVSPIPLPFHSPRFLEFDLLPDIDEDLSHPPYTSRQSVPVSRKRKADPEHELAYPDPKRRTAAGTTVTQPLQARQMRMAPPPKRRTRPTIPPPYYATSLNPGPPAPYFQPLPNYYYAAIA